MSGILRLESLTKGNTLKQGDKTPLKYRLFDADGEKLNIAGKSAKVRLVYPDFLTIGYEKGGLTVAQDDTVTFTIDGVIPSRIYHVEIIVDDKFIFPSRADESKFTVDKSSLGTEANIIEIVGVDAVVKKAVDLINDDPSLIIDEDKLVTDIISNTGIGSIEEYYQQFNDVIKELSKDKDYHSLPEISAARGGHDTLGERLDDTTAQLAQKANQAFVDSQFSSIVSGAPKGTYTDLNSLKAAYPSGAEGIFLVLSDGHWYYWQATTSTWMDGGVYQSSGIANESVRPEHTIFMRYNNIHNKDTFTPNKYMQANGAILDHALYAVSDFIEVLPNTTYVTNSHRQSVFYDGAKNQVGHLDSGRNISDVDTKILTPANTRFMRTNVLMTELETYRLYPEERKYLLTSNVVLDVKNSDLEILQDKNLAKKDNASVGKFLANDGTLSDIPSYTTSDYIELIPGEYDFNVHRRTVFYDENKIIVSYLDSGSILRGKVPITVPNGVKFARTTIPSTDWDSFTIFSRSYQTLEFTDAVNLPKTEIVTESKWEGKSAINFGTSISWQDGKAYTQSADIGKIAKGWQSHVREDTGMTIQNEGVSGSRLTGAGGTRLLAETFNFSPYDAVFFEIATNDFRLDTPLGTLGIMGDTDFSTGTFYGGYRHLIEYVLTSNPEIKIILFTPLQRDNSGYDVNTVNGAGHKLYDYVQAIREIGEMYSLQVIDLYKESGFNKFTLDTFTMDGLHPNDLGYARMGDAIIYHLG